MKSMSSYFNMFWPVFLNRCFQICPDMLDYGNRYVSGCGLFVLIFMWKWRKTHYMMMMIIITIVIIIILADIVLLVIVASVWLVAHCCYCLFFRTMPRALCVESRSRSNDILNHHPPQQLREIIARAKNIPLGGDIWLLTRYNMNRGSDNSISLTSQGWLNCNFMPG